MSNINFSLMPNFRPVVANHNSTSYKNEKCKLFRSSKPDYLDADETKSYINLGIKTIIDFRSLGEYKKSTAEKRLDSYYAIYKAKSPKGYSYKINQKAEYELITRLDDKSCLGRHFFVDFFKMNYVFAVFKRAPWYIQLYSIFWLMIDLVLNTNYRYFVQVFAVHVLNPMGLGGQYIDFLRYSGASIATALKLLSKPENLPAMINCAHGKDRTGVVSALIQALMGKSEEEIAADYSRSEVELECISDIVHEEIVTRFLMCEEFKSTKPQSILEMFAYLKANYGTVEQYMESIGFGHEEQQLLKRNLTSVD